MENLKYTLIIPCYNEQATISKVINDFRKELPGIRVIVIDNNSTDKTAQIAKENGAEVIFEARQGKGFAVETMFRTIESDIYIMVDGDDTYLAQDIHKLIKPVAENSCDMAVGARSRDNEDRSYRKFHLMGNSLVNRIIGIIFKANLKDAMSGYRVFNRRAILSLPIVSSGFEIETEMTIQCLYLNLSFKEIDVSYQSRPVGSESKLETYRDGFRVLLTIFMLFKNLKPLTFFGIIGLVLIVLGLLAGSVPIYEYFSKENHIITHVPLAILASSIMLLAISCLFMGIMLHTINWRIRDLHSVLIRNHRRTGQ